MNPSVSKDQRILSLDVLRGFAVLGILVMNVQHFSMPSAAYSNPMAYGNLEGINRWIWILSHVLANEKFMSLFSMLFGAGVLLFNERTRAAGLADVVLHYRRMGWLLVFGLLHAYLFWSGDILVCYSLCGMLVFVFRKIKSPRLLVLSFAFFIVPLLMEVFFTYSMPFWPEENLEELRQAWNPDREHLAATLEAYRGSIGERMAYRAGESLFMQTGIFLMSVFWRVMSMMLLGMVLYRRGILSAERSKKYYLVLLSGGLSIGFTLSAFGVIQNFNNNWSLEYSMFRGGMYNYIGSVAVALGYMAGIMLICRSGALKGFKRVLAAAGRMAFSNYILQTLICSFIFYGYGLGFYGRAERWVQALIVPGIWFLVLTISRVWLGYFRQGPLEALWRGLTYRKWTSLRMR